MKVGFTDPQGPRLWRVLPYLAAPLVFCVSFIPELPSSCVAAAIFVSCALFNLTGILQPRQMKARTAELALGPGFIDVKHAGTRSQRIHARDVTGGTTARTRNGFLFTMQVRGRSQPVTLEVDSEDDLAKLRHALGIGHGGFGSVGWMTRGDPTATTGFWARAVAAAASLGAAFLLLALGSASIPLVSLLSMVGIFASLLGLLGFTARPFPTVVMAWDGLRLLTSRGWFCLPYPMLASIQSARNRLAFHLVQPPPPAMPTIEPAVVVDGESAWVNGLSANDVRHLLAQVNASAQRARGFGPLKDDVRGRVETLRRGGESLRDWLVRLDLAGQSLSAGAGYRGQSLDVEDLWAVLEDPEAESELRAAAARVLRHVRQPEARLRIDTAVAAVRDDADHKRIRIALSDDLDRAAEDLAVEEAERAYAAQNAGAARRY